MTRCSRECAMTISGQSGTVRLDGKNGMTPEDFYRVVYTRSKVEISKSILKNIGDLRGKLDELIAMGVTMYGINTGIGSKKTETMESAEEIAEFQRRFIAAHCVGVGEPLPESVARGMVYLRLLSFTHNHSGIRPELAVRLAAMLNHSITPVIPSQGSVGASGDLAPLSHLAACVMGTMHTRNNKGKLVPSHDQPKVYVNGSAMNAGDAWKKAGEQTYFPLAAKEALALTNGATMIHSQALCGLIELENLFNDALHAAALSCEALRIEVSAFDERIVNARAHNGAVEVAKEMRDLLAGSVSCTPAFRREFARVVMELFPDRVWKKLRPEVPRLQDAYSFRAIPQVLGAVRDAMTHVRAVLTREMESATDNPLIFSNGDQGVDVLSGANFHGEPLALAVDYLKIAASEIASIAERRIAALLDPAHNYGLPSDLALSPQDTGLMILQYTAAALVSENKVLSHPASVDSIPTSAGQEDHVSMGSIGARQLSRIVANVRRVVAIEIICGTTGIKAVERICKDGKIAALKLGKGTRNAFNRYSEFIGELAEDSYLAPLVERVADELAAL